MARKFENAVLFLRLGLHGLSTLLLYENALENALKPEKVGNAGLAL